MSQAWIENPSGTVSRRRLTLVGSAGAFALLAIARSFAYGPRHPPGAKREPWAMQPKAQAVPVGGPSLRRKASATNGGAGPCPGRLASLHPSAPSMPRVPRGT